MTYITGDTIKKLREKKKLTQKQLAEKLTVTDKAVSKWETGRGFPDISLFSELAGALSVSVPELLTGDIAANANVSANMKRSKFYVCPICGNVIHAMGEGAFSCCGIRLPPLEEETTDGAHRIVVGNVEDELFISLDHPMEKGHFIPSLPTFHTMAFRWRSSIRNSSRNFGSAEWDTESSLRTVTVMDCSAKIFKGDIRRET